MRIAMFYHSLVSDWNNGNAHFLRGIVTELLMRGHHVEVFEPANGWSVRNLLVTGGMRAINDFHEHYPLLKTNFYNAEDINLDAVLADKNLVIVHEWNEQELIHKLGEHRKLNTGYKLLFHDTHHRSISEPKVIEGFNLQLYDGVLAFGKAIADIYLENKWTTNAWVLHEAADIRIFKPIRNDFMQSDLVWVGNWGDDERTAEINEFLIGPSQALKLNTNIYGVRYPVKAKRLLRKANINYQGWLANFFVPQVFCNHRATVHILRKPYTKMLPGIPTIRVFEALACGIPLICSPWNDCENLFSPGKDYLIAKNSRQMVSHLQNVLNEPALASQLVEHGLHTIKKRHTCSHRVDELMNICIELGISIQNNEQKLIASERMA